MDFKKIIGIGVVAYIAYIILKPKAVHVGDGGGGGGSGSWLTVGNIPGDSPGNDGAQTSPDPLSIALKIAKDIVKRINSKVMAVDMATFKGFEYMGKQAYQVLGRRIEMRRDFKKDFSNEIEKKYKDWKGNASVLVAIYDKFTERLINDNKNQ